MTASAWMKKILKALWELNEDNTEIKKSLAVIKANQTKILKKLAE